MTGIYKIQSKLKPERFYIGSGVDIKKRWYQHSFRLKNDKHHSTKLQRHTNKYGINDLDFSVIVECNKESLLTYEQFYIDSLIPYFNECKIAGSPLGFKHSEETKAKMRVNCKPPLRLGCKVSDEARHKISEANKGKKVSQETKDKISALKKGNTYLLGKNRTDETKRRISEGHKGKIVSEETKRRMSKSNKGRKLSDDTKNKIREAITGIKRSEESIRKSSEKRIGAKRSEETKEKMRQSRLKYIENGKNKSNIIRRLQVL